MKDYKELYKKMVDENEEIDKINRINEIVFDMMRHMPDPELWEMLTEEYPGCGELFFLNQNVLADLIESENGDKVLAAIRRNNYDNRVDFDDEFLIYWNDEVETVNRVADICYLFDWDYIFDDLLYYRIWDYIDVEENPELMAIFEEPTQKDLITTAAKKIIERKYDFIPEWVKEWAIAGIVEYSHFTDLEWVADYLTGGLEADIDKIVDIWC